MTFSASDGMDEHYAARAIEHAKIAARNLEEAKQYAEEISDGQLRKETEEMIDRIIERV